MTNPENMIIEMDKSFEEAFTKTLMQSSMIFCFIFYIYKLKILNKFLKEKNQNRLEDWLKVHNLERKENQVNIST